jgi:single stranded DNA-binding protein
MLKAEIIGNLGHDATTRQINGKDYVCFDVAHGERQNGERRTVWISILWAGNGGNLLQYLRKGATVFVRGDFSAKLYTNRDGNVNISQSIMAREVQMCSFVEREQTQTNNGYIQAPQAQYQQFPTPSPQQAVPAAPAANLDNPDDDLPF